MADPFYTRHRGPYRLHVTRPGTKGRTKGEWLGPVDGIDAADEAAALLTDPRDTIAGVYVWSDHEQQFCAGWTREQLEGTR